MAMRRKKLAPQSSRAGHCSLVLTTGLTALLLLSACGATDDAATDQESASDSPSTSASASVSATPSTSPSTTSEPSASPDASSDTESTPEPAETPAASAPAPAPDSGAPEPERTAQAPEVGLPSATPFVPPSSAAGASGGQDAAAAVPGACTVSQLAGAASPEQGAAGSVLASLSLTNTGSAPCTLQGYPGVSFVDAQGNPVGAPAARSGAASAPVVLQPGQSSAASLRIVQPGVIGQVCNAQDTQGLRVYPPGSLESLVVSYPGQACGNPKVGQLEVHGFGS